LLYRWTILFKRSFSIFNCNRQGVFAAFSGDLKLNFCMSSMRLNRFKKFVVSGDSPSKKRFSRHSILCFMSKFFAIFLSDKLFSHLVQARYRAIYKMPSLERGGLLLIGFYTIGTYKFKGRGYSPKFLHGILGFSSYAPSCKIPNRMLSQKARSND